MHTYFYTYFYSKLKFTLFNIKIIKLPDYDKNSTLNGRDETFLIIYTGYRKIDLLKRTRNISPSFFNQIEQLFFFNEREIFKALFDAKSCYIDCSKVSSFTSIQNLDLCTDLSKTFLQCLFFVRMFNYRQYR